MAAKNMKTQFIKVELDMLEGLSDRNGEELRFYFADNDGLASGNAYLVCVDDIDEQTARELVVRGGSVLRGRVVEYDRRDDGWEASDALYWTGWQISGEMFAVGLAQVKSRASLEEILTARRVLRWIIEEANMNPGQFSDLFNLLNEAEEKTRKRLK